ncbi:MAG: PAS domain S-box protein [Nitrospirae bacterium]|nr:PAS domain S-box protein [Nitrospirota bacterium]
MHAQTLSLLSHPVEIKNCPISNAPCPGDCIFSNILQNVGIGIIVFDTVQKVLVFQNQESRRLFQGFIEHPDYRTLSDLLLSGDSSSEGEAITLTVGRRFLGFTVYRINHIYRWVFIRDVTDKERTEEQVRAAHRMNRAVLERSPYGIIVVNKTGAIDYVNPAMIAINAGTYEEITAINVYNFPAYLSLGIASGIRAAIEEGKDFFIGPVEYTSALGGKTTIRNFVGMPFDDDGDRKALVFVEDVTEQKRIEAQNALLAATVESATDAVVITDARGTIQYVNPAFEQITGYGRAEVIGRSPRILKSGKQDETFYRTMWNTLKDGQVWRGVLINKRADGSLYDEEMTIFPVRSASGEILNFVASMRDITVKAKLEAIAEAVNCMDNIGYVFAGIRHEIGNPVNSTKMALTVLHDNLGTYSPETTRNYIERALTELSRVEYLLQSLRSFNMFESPKIEQIDVNFFMDSFLSLVKKDFDQSGVALKAIIHPEVTSMAVDPRALQQVLLNIVTNALDAAEEDEEPKVIINVFRLSDCVRMQIIDNGRGMSPQQIRDLFKPFHTTKQKGTGLGLVIVKKMLTKMHCTIDISSESGAGTIVDIVVPEVQNEFAAC